MATAIYVANRALRLILVQASNAPLQSEEYKDFYDAMNDYMAAIEVVGVDLGYTPITTGTQQVTIPPGAIRGLIANMAVEVAPDFGKSVKPELVEQAKKGYHAMRRIARKRVQTSLPSTLPRGSGNERFSYSDDAFYVEQSSARIVLANNDRVTEITAANTPVLINGFWTTVESQNISADISGRLTNSSLEAKDIEIEVELEVTGGVPVTLHVYENGNESLTSVSGTADGSKILLRYSTTFLPKEFIELWIENDSDTTDLVVRDCQFVVS